VTHVLHDNEQFVEVKSGFPYGVYGLGVKSGDVDTSLGLQGTSSAFLCQAIRHSEQQSQRDILVIMPVDDLVQLNLQRVSLVRFRAALSIFTIRKSAGLAPASTKTT